MPAEIYVNDWPTKHCPDETNEFAIAIPPPNSKSIPHGISEAVDHSSNFSPFPFGIRNIATTAIKATLASFAFGKFSQDCQPPNGWLRLVQAIAVRKKTVKTLFSSLVQALISGMVTLPRYPRFRVIHNPAIGISIATTGIPRTSR